MRLSLVRYRLKGIDAVILDDDTVWRKPFTVKLVRNGTTIERTHGWKELKPFVYKGNIYYKIKSQLFSERQLQELAVEHFEQIEIPARNIDKPFMKKR